MRIDVLGLQAFVSIAERGSFRAAASHLNLSQTALSHRIRKLEESLSLQLLVRTTRQVTLTPAGLALLPRARKVFEELGTTLEDLRSTAREAQERVVMGCLPTVAMRCMPDVIAAFIARYGDIQVIVHDNSASEIADKVQSGRAEFGVTIVSANRWDLELQPIVKEPFVLVCHRSMPLAGAGSLAWAELDGVPLVRISSETGNRILIDDALGSRSESLLWNYEVQRVVTAVSLVRARIGYAVVPKLALDVVSRDDIVAIPLRAPTVTRTLGIITRKGLPLSPAAQDLLDLVVASLHASIAAD
ncbi:LysR family transcriptional regulator [Ancylobacter oerskovii]|uniref:LysR substrate-binding domain-containing protein n=1 Tax=Ancylobacter oerskovii TaxID=459519 RepID=A0ABW4YSU2_9HYPH|nr:LysR family transcriptional regulator [Ancylobacter oerskovii]MBS7543450.1 LysR family transcriptional regulator [Ancylobacter oerskovii]